MAFLFPTQQNSKFSILNSGLRVKQMPDSLAHGFSFRSEIHNISLIFNSFVLNLNFITCGIKY
jgi:hypothetical protein